MYGHLSSMALPKKSQFVETFFLLKTQPLKSVKQLAYLVFLQFFCGTEKRDRSLLIEP